MTTFAEFSRDLDDTPDLDPPDPHSIETRLLAEEAKIRYTMAMLLCLDGRQRLVFVLGKVFGASDTVGAEVLELTPANFRQLLPALDATSMPSWLASVAPSMNRTPCRCARKMRGFVERGYMTPDRLRFNEGHRQRAQNVAPCRADSSTHFA